MELCDNNNNSRRISFHPQQIVFHASFSVLPATTCFVSVIITLCLCKACFEFSQIANSNTASFAPNVLNSGVPKPKFIFLGLLHSFSSHLAFVSRDSARLTLISGSFLTKLFSEGREIF